MHNSLTCKDAQFSESVEDAQLFLDFWRCTILGRLWRCTIFAIVKMHNFRDCEDAQYFLNFWRCTNYSPLWRCTIFAEIWRCTSFRILWRCTILFEFRKMHNVPWRSSMFLLLFQQVTYTALDYWQTSRLRFAHWPIAKLGSPTILTPVFWNTNYVVPSTMCLTHTLRREASFAVAIV